MSEWAGGTGLKLAKLAWSVERWSVESVVSAVTKGVGPLFDKNGAGMKWPVQAARPFNTCADRRTAHRHERTVEGEWTYGER